MALIMAHAPLRKCLDSQGLLCPAVLLPKAGVTPSTVEVPGREDVLIPDALKSAL